jgi:hypothetical protein
MLIKLINAPVIFSEKVKGVETFCKKFAKAVDVIEEV